MFPVYTQNELAADAVVHAIGLTLGFIGALWLSAKAREWMRPPMLFGAYLYCVSLVSLLSFSALYNLVADLEWKEFLRPLDHSAIYFLIAGTYTPVALVALTGWWRIAILTLAWSIAFFGIGMKLGFPRSFENFSIVLYVIQGWTGLLIAFRIMRKRIPLRALLSLTAGGILFTIGVGIHLWDSLPYHNAIWHVFVVIAASCHFAGVVEALYSTKDGCHPEDNTEIDRSIVLPRARSDG